MGAWLYPISSRGGYFFEDKKGRTVDVSYESFRDWVATGRILDEDWVVNQNFKSIQKGDDLFIYTGDDDRGIIGFGKINGVDPKRFSINFNLDRRRTKELMLDPIPAYQVRKWIPFPRKAVINLKPFINELRKWIPWTAIHKKEESLKLSPLKLKPRRKLAVKRAIWRDTRWLTHDTILQPIDTFLKSKGFTAGYQSLGLIRLDLAAVRKNDLIIVEAKVIQPKKTERGEARTGIGQLLDYSWSFKHQFSKAKYRHHLWLAFSERPNKNTIDFIEDNGILVSWKGKNKGVNLSSWTQTAFKKRFCQGSR
jgi:hypothetical protein